MIGRIALLIAAMGPVVILAQRPVYRSSTHFVRVDAYPRTPDGKIIEGLTENDFEILEDGKPQQIATIDFIAFEHWTPEEQRISPASRQAGYDLAADPRYRVFVIVMGGGPETVRTSGVTVDVAPDASMQANVKNALRAFIDRNLGPHDLFAVLHPGSDPNYLTLGQRATLEAALDDSQEGDLEARDRILLLASCGMGNAGMRARADMTYSMLEKLVRVLGAIREERKSIIFVASGLFRAGPDVATLNHTGPGPSPFPSYGIRNGRIGPTSGDSTSDETRCHQEAHRLAYMDFERRFRDLLELARENNVAFYPVSPNGLMTPTQFIGGGRGKVVDMRPLDSLGDSLRTLASETGGIAVVNTNDVGPGVRRIADALDANYVLGYYSTNPKPDGRLRRITVRLKRSGRAIAARNGYRTPDEAETRAIAVASAAAPTRLLTAEEAALAQLDRRRGPLQFASYAARDRDAVRVAVQVPEDAIAAGRWREGADLMAIAEDRDGQGVQSAEGKLIAGHALLTIPVPSDVRLRAVAVRLHADGESLIDTASLESSAFLVGDPLAYRGGNRPLLYPLAILTFAHGDTARLEWPALKRLSSKSARLLDRTGKPLKTRLAVTESASPHTLSAELPIAPLGHGDYLVELTVSSEGATDRRLLALRVR